MTGTILLTGSPLALASMACLGLNINVTWYDKRKRERERERERKREREREQKSTICFNWAALTYTRPHDAHRVVLSQVFSHDVGVQMAHPTASVLRMGPLDLHRNDAIRGGALAGKVEEG
jgi:hypothetical protein